MLTLGHHQARAGQQEAERGTVRDRQAVCRQAVEMSCGAVQVQCKCMSWLSSAGVQLVGKLIVVSHMCTAPDLHLQRRRHRQKEVSAGIEPVSFLFLRILHLQVLESGYRRVVGAEVDDACGVLHRETCDQEV